MPTVWTRLVPADWDRLEEVATLLYETLYRAHGVAIDAPWRHEGEHGALAVAIGEDGAVYGSARLLGAAGDASRQLRQLAVVPAARGHGVGRSLVHLLEEVAASEGAREVWLNARDSAYTFYERIGYRFVGDEFVSELTRTPHRRMSKDVGGWRCAACRKGKTAVWVPCPEPERPGEHESRERGPLIW